MPDPLPEGAFIDHPRPALEPDDDARGPEGRPPPLHIRTLIGAGLIVLVVLAVFAGRHGGNTLGIKLPSVLAVLFGLIALGRNPRPFEPVAGAVLLLYIFLATATEQFAWVWDNRTFLFAVAWLVPPALGAAVLLPRGHWCSGVGCCAVLFAGTAATSFTIHAGTQGAGLFMQWLS